MTRALLVSFLTRFSFIFSLQAIPPILPILIEEFSLTFTMASTLVWLVAVPGILISIIGGLLVNVSNEKFVLPLSSITTTVKINKNEIKSLHGVEVIEHQDKIVPLVRVSDILEIKNDNVSDDATIIIVDKGGKPYGLVVDSFEHKQEIVIKKFSNTSDSE